MAPVPCPPVSPGCLRVHTAGGPDQGHHPTGAEEPDLQVATARVDYGDSDCHVLQGPHARQFQVSKGDWEREGGLSRIWDGVPTPSQPCWAVVPLNRTHRLSLPIPNRPVWDWEQKPGVQAGPSCPELFPAP